MVNLNLEFTVWSIWQKTNLVKGLAYNCVETLLQLRHSAIEPEVETVNYKIKKYLDCRGRGLIGKTSQELRKLPVTSNLESQI